MTTENILSSIITNRDAVPQVKNNDLTAGAQVQSTLGLCTSTTGKTTGSTYRFVEVPSNARVNSVQIQSEAQGTSTAIDVGVYRNTMDGGAVVSAAFFASAIDVSSAVTKTDITNESGTNTIAKQLQPLWQAAGLSVDPGGTLDIVATSTATINTGASMLVAVSYVV